MRDWAKMIKRIICDDSIVEMIVNLFYFYLFFAKTWSIIIFYAKNP